MFKKNKPLIVIYLNTEGVESKETMDQLFDDADKYAAEKLGNGYDWIIVDARHRVEKI